MKEFLDALRAETEARIRLRSINNFLDAGINVSPASVERAENRLEQAIRRTEDAFDNLSDAESIAVQGWFTRFIL